MAISLKRRTGKEKVRIDRRKLKRSVRSPTLNKKPKKMKVDPEIPELRAFCDPEMADLYLRKNGITVESVFQRLGDLIKHGSGKESLAAIQELRRWSWDLLSLAGRIACRSGTMKVLQSDTGQTRILEARMETSSWEGVDPGFLRKARIIDNGKSDQRKSTTRGGLGDGSGDRGCEGFDSTDPDAMSGTGSIQRRPSDSIPGWSGLAGRAGQEVVDDGWDDGDPGSSG